MKTKKTLTQWSLLKNSQYNSLSMKLLDLESLDLLSKWTLKKKQMKQNSYKDVVGAVHRKIIDLMVVECWPCQTTFLLKIILVTPCKYLLFY